MEHVYLIITNLLTLDILKFTATGYFTVDDPNLLSDTEPIYMPTTQFCDKLDTVNNRLEFILASLAEMKTYTKTEYMKDLYKEDEFGGYGKYRSRGDVDNILSCLMITNSLVTSTPIEHKKLGENVLQARQVFDAYFAESVRLFIRHVPFNRELPKLNDVTNPPKNSVFREISLYRSDRVDLEALPSDWSYEKYNPTFWRLLPNTVSSFFGSPIYKLLQKLKSSLIVSKPFGLDLSKMAFNTVVLQRTEIGMVKHYDGYEGINRVLSFIYYLTDDLYSSEDGGQLQILDPVSNEVQLSINPEFNSLICFHVKTATDFKGPLHQVSTVLSKKARFAIVGFFNS